MASLFGEYWWIGLGPQLLLPLFVWWRCFRGRVGVLRLHSLTYCFVLWAWLPFVVGCNATSCDVPTSPGLVEAALLVAYISMGISWLVMMLETVYSREYEYIDNTNHSEPVAEYIRKIRDEKPTVEWSIRCYHWKTFHHTRYYRNDRGVEQSRRETGKKTVTTYEETLAFPFKYWTDDSPPQVEGVDQYRVTRIRLESEVQPGDEETAREVKRVKTEFRDRNIGKDDLIELKEEMSLPQHEERIALYVDEAARSCWIGTCVFLLISLIGLTWLYRWLFLRLTCKTHYKLSKKFYMSPPQVPAGSDVIVEKVDDDVLDDQEGVQVQAAEDCV